MAQSLDLLWKIVRGCIPICTIIAVVIAVCSLNEATRARRDTFLPIITVKRQHAGFNFLLQNCGKGIAIDVEAKWTGSAAPFSLEVLNVGDDRTFYYESEEEVFLNLIPDMQFMITYFDIFHRKIKTTYDVTQEKKGEKFIPNIVMDSYKIDLP